MAYMGILVLYTINHILSTQGGLYKGLHMQLRSHNATRKLVGQTNLKDASSAKAHAGKHNEEVEPAVVLSGFTTLLRRWTWGVVPLKWIEYGLHGDLSTIYHKPYSIHSGGTIHSSSHATAQSQCYEKAGRSDELERCIVGQGPRREA